MTLKELIKKAQLAMNAAGANPPFQGTGEIAGGRTEAEMENYEFEVTAKRKEMPPEKLPNGAINPAYEESKKYAGKGEHDKAFVAWLSKFWPKTGLNYKTIIGSSFAWCALWIVAMNSEVGQKYVASAGAKRQAAYGVEIDYKKNGAPRGAVVHINSKSCDSGSGNHVSFLDGDCTAEDFKRSGGTIALFGGNQANKVKRSVYANTKVCAVRWPKEVQFPGPVTKSLDCTGAVSSGESTR